MATKAVEALYSFAEATLTGGTFEKGVWGMLGRQRNDLLKTLASFCFLFGEEVIIEYEVKSE